LRYRFRSWSSFSWRRTWFWFKCWLLENKKFLGRIMGRSWIY